MFILIELKASVNAEPTWHEGRDHTRNGDRIGQSGESLIVSQHLDDVGSYRRTQTDVRCLTCRTEFRLNQPLGIQLEWMDLLFELLDEAEFLISMVNVLLTTPAIASTITSNKYPELRSADQEAVR